MDEQEFELGFAGELAGGEVKQEAQLWVSVLMSYVFLSGISISLYAVSNIALHKDPNNTTISCLTGCNPNTDHAPWKGGEFLVGYGCYAFDLEPGTDPASHELSPPRNKTGTRPQAARFWGTTPRTSTASSPSGRRTARARSACATH